jgi:hypothetical protein
MLRIQMHIETAKWFNPGEDYTSYAGHVMLPGNL